MSNDAPEGLASVADVEALADQLSRCADELHARILRELRERGTSEAAQAAAQALFDDELVLRQRANALYTDAATSVVKGLGTAQQNVTSLTTEATEKIRKIAVFGDVTDLVGGLLMLAGAAATGQPAPIVAALEKIRHQLKALNQDQPAKGS